MRRFNLNGKNSQKGLTAVFVTLTYWQGHLPQNCIQVFLPLSQFIDQCVTAKLKVIKAPKLAQPKLFARGVVWK